MKEFISGIAVGIANIIPGVSGGTMMVVMGVFNRIMEAIAGIFQLHNPNRKSDLLFLLKIAVGAVLGLVVFAKVIDFLFANYEVETLWWFIGMVIASIPVFLKKEMKNDKIRLLPFILGVAIILTITYLNPGKSAGSGVVFPEVTLMHLLFMCGIGFIAGFTMLLPGVSGSMVLLIIGQYHLFKGYLANVTSFEFNILAPLAIMGIGIVIGIVASAKMTKFLLEKSETSRINTLSLILGLVVASSFVLIPITTYTTNTVIVSIITFMIGAFMVFGLERLA